MDSIDFQLKSNIKDMKQVQNIFTLYQQYASYANAPEKYMDSNEHPECYRLEFINSNDTESSIESILYDDKMPGIILEDEKDRLKDAYNNLQSLNGAGLISTEVIDWIHACHKIELVVNDEYYNLKFVEGQAYVCIILDNQTNKILKLVDSTDLMNEKISKEMLLEYASYLNLDIINDWTYNGTMIDSTSAGLKVVYAIGEKERQLVILPSEIPFI